MKAAVVERPGIVVVKDVPESEVGENDILVKVRTASICNATDNHIVDGTFEGGHDRYPQILGHEVHGEVADYGSKVEGVEVGERLVTYTPHGAFCEYTILNASLFARSPDELSDEEAPLCEMVHGSLLGTVYPAGLKDGERVVVVGQGPMGLVTTQCVKAMADVTLGAVDLVDFRLEKASEVGADFVYNSSGHTHAKVAEQIGRDMGPVDLVILCTAVDQSKAQDLFDFGVQVLRRGGRLTGLNVEVKGLPHRVSVHSLFHKNILLRRSLFDVYPEDPQARLAKLCEVFQMGVNWVRDSKVNMKALITHVLPLDEIEKGLWLCRERPGETIKVIIDVAGSA
jgi:threonine dehydrogenase-like Zn-dependent dehydrogenase